MRLIDADALLKKLPREELVSRIIVAGMPTIYPPNGYKVLADGRGWEYYGKEEAEPVRRGRWLVTPYTEYDNTYKCSVCSMEWAFLEGEPKNSGANYCPNCGAKMEASE